MQITRGQGRGRQWKHVSSPGIGEQMRGLSRELQVSPEGVCGVFGVADVRMAVADTATADADVLDAVIVLHPPAMSTAPSTPAPPPPGPYAAAHATPLPACTPPPPTPHGTHQAGVLTRRVTVGSRSALPMRWPSSVFVRRKRRRMLVALVKSRSRGE